jgi:hypothetical protein
VQCRDRFFFEFAATESEKVFPRGRIAGFLSRRAEKNRAPRRRKD